jgi:hypothetical protein
MCFVTIDFNWKVYSATWCVDDLKSFDEKKKKKKKKRWYVSFIISVEFHTHISASISSQSMAQFFSFSAFHFDIFTAIFQRRCTVDYNVFFFIWIIKPGKGWGRIAFDRISQTIICDAESNAGRNEVDSRVSYAKSGWQSKFNEVERFT